MRGPGIGPQSVWLPAGIASLCCEIVKESLCVSVTLSSVPNGEGDAPHSSTLAWKIPWMEEPGGLQSMGSLWVGHD